MKRIQLSNLIGDAPFWRRVLKLGLPIVLQNLLAASYSLIDTLMIAGLGTEALSAVGMAGQWSFLFNMILFGVCSAAGMFVSQYFGAKEEDNIRRTTGLAALSAGAISLVMVLALTLFPRTLIGFLTDDPVIAEQVLQYIRIVVWSYPSVALTLALGSVLRSCENVKLPTVASIIATTLNVVMNYAFIYGKLGAPEMGIAGAALATLISSWVGTTFLIVAALARRTVLRAPLSAFFGLSRDFVRLFFRRAVPVIFNEGSWGLGTFLLNAIYTNYDAMGYAAKTIFGTFENIAFVAFVGLCNAGCIMIGKSVGEGKIDRAVKDAKRFSFLVPFAGVVLGAVIILFRHPLASIFNMGNNIAPETLALAANLMLIYALELPVRNIPYIQIVGIYRSSGDTSTGMRYDLICLWLLSLPVTYLSAMVFHLPFELVFFLMYISEDYLKTFLCIRHFRSRKWLKPVTDEGKAGLAAYLAEQA